MTNVFYKHFILLINKSSIMVGGQAVIEGVMMRVPGYYATAVRTPQNSIEVIRKPFTPTAEYYKLANIPILRGFLHLVDSMKIGYQTLDWSASIEDNSQNKEPNKIVNFFITIFSILFTITLFMGIPYIVTDFGLNKFPSIKNNQLIFNCLAGLLRMTIFLLYLYLLSHLKDVKRLFQYHGAEHKVIYNFESGNKLSITQAQKFSTKHPRCGTSFIFILMMITIVTYSTTDSLVATLFSLDFTLVSRIVIHLLLLPIVAGIGYEVLKFLARNQKNTFFSVLSKPGLWLQSITTNEPTDSQIEISITALKTAFGDKIEHFEGQQFQADAIG